MPTDRQIVHYARQIQRLNPERFSWAECLRLAESRARKIWVSVLKIH